MKALDPDICRAARISRDPRFDGEFFLAVTTTGIYCRPVCPARPPREKNVRYYHTAAAAAQEGFRPCLRCRPESAPNSPAWAGTSTTVKRGLALISSGYLNQHSLEQLAGRLGVGERYLRKLFEAQLGVSPSAVAKTQRLHFAQKLLRETDLSITEIAFASGFGSVRRFNSAHREAFACTPGEMRRNKPRPGDNRGIRLELAYRPPYDWDGVLDYFRRHQVEGIEQVDEKQYQRSLATPGGGALLKVRPLPDRNALELDLMLSDYGDMMGVVSQVRRMFDLDAQPGDIRSALSLDPMLAPLLEQWPGIRSPICASLFEAGVRAVVGQQVSIEAARNVCARLARDCTNEVVILGERRLLFPTPEQLLELPDAAFPMPGRRRESLRALCRSFLESSELDQDERIEQLADIKGIGPWTLDVINMRGYGDPDVFPVADLGLIKAAQSLREMERTEFTQHIERWAPWRAYAANLLWRQLCHV